MAYRGRSVGLAVASLVRRFLAKRRTMLDQTHHLLRPPITCRTPLEKLKVAARGRQELSQGLAET